MNRKLLAAATTAILGVCVLYAAGPPRLRPTDNDPSAIWIHVTFGLDGQKADWSGSISAQGASIDELIPWGFEARDQFDADGRSWRCTTELRRGRSANSFAEPYRGFFVKLSNVGSSAAIRVQTKQGDFTVPVAELAYDRLLLFLDARAAAQQVPAVHPVPGKEGHDDFPSATTDSDGNTWLAWIRFDEENLRDQLLVASLAQPNTAPEIVPAGRYLSSPQLLTDRQGNLLLFWCEWDGEDWDIYCSRRVDGQWQKPKPVVQAAGNDIFLQAARSPDGAIWLVWQGYRAKQPYSQIFCMRLLDDRADGPIAVTGGAGNKWEPAVDVSSDGTAWIAYDSYERGNYDVFLVAVRLDGERLTVGSPIPIATSADFEAHASVDARDERFVWVAYDAAGPNWGKDYARYSTRRNGRYAEPLHASRRIELRAYDRKRQRLWQPTAPLPQVRNPKMPARVAHSYQDEVIRFYELPQLVRDAAGRLWVLYRLNRQGYCGHPRMGAVWELCATTFLDGRWTAPLILPHSRGRQEQKAAIARSSTATVIAWASGHHHVDQPYRLFWASLPELPGVQRWAFQPAEPGQAPKLEEPVVRSWRTTVEGQQAEVVFGDLHRHTEISLCTPTVDGSLTETYRYAIDAARLDFLAVTDHTRDTDPYPWWLTQKAADFFYHPGFFVSIYAYERSNAIVNGGHRNVFFRDRNWPVLRSDAHYAWARLPRPDTRPNVSLYPRLRGRWAFTIAHTPGYNRREQKGTWTYNDPQVEPVAEIFQAYRRDYERPDRGVPEEASLWYALGRGYRLGFIASSDHHSTHLSYACVWASGRTREAVFRGIRDRHSYGATDKILLEVRLGTVLMGGEVRSDAIEKRPALQIRVRGTAPIAELQIVRSARVIATFQPGTKDVSLAYEDEGYPGGKCYYYVRVKQEDGNIAWGSPIWVIP